MTLRDLARFGMLFTRDDISKQPSVISEAILHRLIHEGRPHLLLGKHPQWVTHAGYQWDVMNTDGVMVKGGFGGQLLYIDTQHDVVIAMFCTNPMLDSPPPLLPLNQLVATFFNP